MKRKLQFLILFAILELLYGVSIAQTVVSTTTYTSTTTWTCPVGITTVDVECWGGGGGGGAANTANGAGSGGGGGAYAKVNSYAVTPGNDYLITVGTGGAGGNASAGGNGGATSFTTICIAAGGTGGTRNAGAGGSGGLTSACTGDVLYAGGTGGTSTNGSGTYSGGGGAGAGSTVNGANASNQTPGAGAAGGGSGAAGITAFFKTNNPNVAGIPGGGGGGGKTGGGAANATGSAGARGQVIITAYCSAPSISASGLSASVYDDVTLTLGFDRGNGESGVIVVCRPTASAAVAPTLAGTSYTGNLTYGSGTLVGTDNYCVYNAATTGHITFDVTGLTTGTSYNFDVYEYNLICYTTAETTSGTPASGCSNPPAQATATPSDSYICTTGSTSISLSGLIPGAYSYQWQQSLDNGISDPWTNVTGGSGANLSTYTTPALSQTTYYRCNVTCAATTTSLSIPVYVYTNIQASNFSIGASTSTTQILNWSDAGYTGLGTAGGDDNDGVIVVVKQGSSPTDPTSGTSYTADPTNTFGNNTAGYSTAAGSYVIYKGSGTSVTINGLIPSTTYYYAIYSYSETTNCYNLTSPISGNFTTASCSPATDATSFVSSAITNNSMTISFDRGSGTRVLILAHATTAIVSTGQSLYNQDFSAVANSAYGTPAAQVGSTGDYVVYDGDDAGTVNVNLTNLSPGITYNFLIFEYNASPNCYSITPLSGSATALNPGVYSSSTVVQPVTTNVAPLATNKEIVYVSIPITGGLNPAATVNSITFNINGTTTSADITSAQLYYTTTTTFSTANPFGSAVSSPEAATPYTVTATRNLQVGNNYFWVAYNIAALPPATQGDVVDAEITSFNLTTYAGGTADYNPSPTAPAGSRTISLTYCSFSSSYGACYGGLNNYGLTYLNFGETTMYSAGCTAGTYLDYYSSGSTPVTVTQGQTYTVNASRAGTGYASKIYIFVDWNNNGVWTDAGENIIAASLTSGTPNTITPVDVTVPVGATVGQHRMRAVAAYNTAPTSCNGNQATAYDFKVIVESACTSPTTQASSFSTSNLTINSVQANWMRGDGDAGVIVVVRGGAAPTSDPVSGTTYTADANFGGTGSAIGGGKVVYIGTGTDVNVTGLTGGTTYYFNVYEYNSTGVCYKAPALTGNILIPNCYPPTIQASWGTPTLITTTSGTLNWTRGDGDGGVLVVARSGASPTAGPIAGTSYTADADYNGTGSDIGGGKVVYIGTGTSVNMTGLIPSTVYYISIYEYMVTGLCYSGATTGNLTAASCSPSTDASVFTASNVLNNTATISWTRGNGNRVLVVARSGSAINITGQNIYNQDFSATANANFGSGANINSSGNYAIYDGTGTTMNITGLSQTTTYHFAIFEYNISPNCYSITPLTGNIITLDPNPGTGTPNLSCQYTFSGGSGFTTIVGTGSTQLASGTGIDDQNYSATFASLTNGTDFIFNYQGTDYNSIGINANGFIWFGTGNPATSYASFGGYPIGSANANLGGSGIIDGLIAAAGADLIAHYHISSSPNPSQINVVITGTAPNRVCTIEWSGFQAKSLGSDDMCWFSGYSDDSRLDFQIKLYEKGGTAGNRIQLTYRNQGPFCVYDSYSFQIGMRGASNTDYLTRSGTGLNTTGGSNGTSGSSTINMTSSAYISTNVTLTYNNTLSKPLISGNTSNICPDFTTTLTSSASSNNQWFKDGNLVNGPGSNLQNYTASENGSYTVATHSGTCYSSSDPIIITINPCDGCIPVNDVEISPNTAQSKCQNESITFTVSSFTGDEPITYQWRKDGSDINGETNSSYTINSVQAFNAGEYTCYLTNCDGAYFKASPGTELTVKTLAVIKFSPANASVKDGGTTSFSIAAPGSNIDFEWQVNMNDGSGWSTINNGGSNPAYSGATSNKLIIADATMVMNGYNYRCIVGNDCAPLLTSATATLTVRSSAIEGLWIGVTSTAWQTGSNWDTGFEPTAGTSVTIPLSAINKPEISAGITGVCANLTIMPRASLVVKTNGTLNVSGNFSIESDITGTGALLTEDNATITVTGKSIFKQYIAKLGYHYITSVIDGSSLAQINDDMPLKNLNGLYYNIDNPPPQNLLPDVWKYDEPASAADPDNNEYMGAWLAPNGMEAMPYIKGYALVMKTEPVTIDMEGDNYKFYNGDLSYNLTKGGNGYNITGNPYPSPIDWDLIAPTLPAGVNRGITFFYGTSLYYGGFGTYHPLTGPGGAYPHEQYIPSMQAFYLKVSNPATITLKNSHRTVAPEALGVEFYKKKLNKKIEFPVLKLKAYMADNYNLADEAVIYFNNEATKGFDDKFDVPKMLNTIPELPNIFTSSDKEHLSINGLPAITDNLIIPLYYKVAVTGKYTLQVSDLSNFDVNTNAYLFDILTGQSYILTDKSKLIFNISSDEQNPRFYIKFNKGISGLENNSDKELVYVYSNNGNIIVNYNNPKGEIAKMNIFTVEGKAIENEINLSNGTYTYSKSLVSGLYFIKITTTKQVYFKKLFIE